MNPRVDYFFYVFSTTTLVQRAITISRNLSYGWRVNWSEIQIWNSSLCPRCCHRRSLWIHNGSNKSKRISRKLKRQHYRKTTKTFSLFNVAGVAFTVRPTRVSMVVSRTRIGVEDSFYYYIKYYIYSLKDGSLGILSSYPSNSFWIIRDPEMINYWGTFTAKSTFHCA